MRKWMARGLLAGVVLTSPLLLILGWLLFASVDLLVLVTVGYVEVANGSGETVWITPLGQLHGNLDGDRSVLPQYAIRVPAIPAFKQGDFRLAAGQTRRFYYDFSDFMISDIVVADAAGGVRLLETPRDGVMPRSFTIPTLDDLPPAPDSVRWAAREDHYAWLLWGVILSSLIPVALFVVWQRVNSASRHSLVLAGSQLLD